MKRKWKRLLLTAYAVAMLWLLYGQRMVYAQEIGLQLRPFATLELFWNSLRQSQDPWQKWQAVANLLGNVVLFIPLGFFLPWIWKKWRKFWRQLLLMTALILFVEITQLCFGLGWCDVDDLLLNLIGTTMGYGIWACACKKGKIRDA